MSLSNILVPNNYNIFVENIQIENMGSFPMNFAGDVANPAGSNYSFDYLVLGRTVIIKYPSMTFQKSGGLASPMFSVTVPPLPVVNFRVPASLIPAGIVSGIFQLNDGVGNVNVMGHMNIDNTGVITLFKGFGTQGGPSNTNFASGADLIEILNGYLIYFI